MWNALETCMLLMMGDWEYGDWSAIPGVRGMLARAWFWLYIGVVSIILLNALLAIIVAGYDSANGVVDPTWREPLRSHSRLTWLHFKHTKQKGEGADTFLFSNIALKTVLGEILTIEARTAESCGSKTDLLTQEQRIMRRETSKRQSIAQAHGGNKSLFLPYERFCAAFAARSEEDIELTEGLVISLFGMKVDEQQLGDLFLKVLENTNTPPQLHSAVAFNVLLRVGVPGDDLTDEDLEATFPGKFSSQMRKRISAFLIHDKRDSLSPRRSPRSQQATPRKGP